MNPHRASTAVATLTAAQTENQPLRMAFFDVDDTWTGTANDQFMVRQMLESLRFVIAVVTNRTAEMSMSWKEKNKSSASMQQRSPARFRLQPDREYEVVDPSVVPTLKGLLDPDIIIGTTGTELLLKQTTGGYQPDSTYYQRFPPSSKDWQAKIKATLNQCERNGMHFKIPVLSDVSSPEWRILIHPATQKDLDELLEKLRTPYSHVVHDNKVIFITPAKTSKEIAVDHVVANILKLLNIEASVLNILFAGNSIQDAAMGFNSARGTKATFIIPGGSSLYHELQQPDLAFMRHEMTTSISSATLPLGVYQVKSRSRYIVLGDEAFPDTKGPQTLIAWLRQAYT